MNLRNFVCISIAAGTLVTATGCGSAGSGTGQSMTTPAPTTPAPTTPAPQDLTVAAIQGLASTTSETNDPTAVNAGAVTVQPQSDETSDPSSVNQ